MAIGLGSHDIGVPAYTAQLYHAGCFPRLSSPAPSTPSGPICSPTEKPSTSVTKHAHWAYPTKRSWSNLMPQTPARTSLLQRFIEYPRQGFAIAQDVPQDVLDAYQCLINDGFISRLLTT
ncbi:hypothetical protein BJ973_004999 [Actinoplanes tereljensis]|uniref:hypothetical protein n=1 Tax=Paractinoplanes tereljensis TaxID=571912 RepID=UPI001EF3BE21|nr:hypothetical protein [Actinoplanes tereljensis]